jgi:hypothetical protein
MTTGLLFPVVDWRYAACFFDAVLGTEISEHKKWRSLVKIAIKSLKTSA